MYQSLRFGCLVDITCRSPDFQTSRANRKTVQDIDVKAQLTIAFCIQVYASVHYSKVDKSRMYVIYPCLICSALQNDNQLKVFSSSVHWLQIWVSSSLPNSWMPPLCGTFIERIVSMYTRTMCKCNEGTCMYLTITIEFRFVRFPC